MKKTKKKMMKKKIKKKREKKKKEEARHSFHFLIPAFPASKSNLAAPSFVPRDSLQQ